MDVVALIPARGGSKGIPRKNLAVVAGKPLIVFTLEAARAAATVTRVVCSTDSEEIADVARAHGAEVPFLRPPALAADDSPMLDVVRHADRELGEPDVIVVLQPTSPLRRPEDIDAAVELLQSSGADVVVSVVAVPHRFAPESLMRFDGDRVVPLSADVATRRQDKETLWARNGPAVLALHPERLRAGGELYGGDCRGYVMQERESIDVDTPFDLELAQLLLGGDT